MRTRHLLTAALILASLLAFLPAALANNIGSAKVSPTVGGDVALTIPADGHQVYKLNLVAGDWLVAYAWAPGTQTGAATIRVLDPSATDVASDTVASSANGILFFQAPVQGSYYCDLSAAAGTQVTRGLFISRPKLALKVARTVVVPYNGSFTPSAVFTDPLYNYIAYDGPAVAFETIVLRSSRDGVSWKGNYSGTTDVNGRYGHLITGLTRRINYVFDYAGSVYDSSAFGSVRSPVISLIPRVRLVQSVPAAVTHGVGFAVKATVQPKLSAGTTNVVVEAHKKGSATILKFSVQASSTSKSATPLRSSVALPSAGTWYVRFHRPTDANNAETATKWVLVSVR
jgi:hypothetical protein